jgi:PAS domain S-box-containing protein
MTSVAAALDLEIALLRERLEDAEDMRRAITAGEVDGFVVDVGTSERVVLLETATRPSPYDNARLPCVTVSRSGHILYANHGFAKLIDRGLRELYSSPLREFVPAEHQGRLAQFLDPHAPDSAIEIELVTGHGTSVPSRLVTVDVGHGFASLLVIDTREDLRLQEAELAVDAIANGEVDAIVVGGSRVVLVHDADQSFRELIDRMDQGAASISRLGLVQNVNEPLAAMLGRQRHELLGTDFFALVREKQPRLAATVADPCSTGPLQFEVSLVRSDGSTIPVEIALVPARDDDDPVTLVVTDLTERHRHQRIEEETRRKDEFLAVLAHELRNPLASIRTCVEILHRSAGLGTNERQSVQIMGRQTGTLVRLVDDLLDIHRLNEGKIVVRRQPLSLQEVVRDAAEGIHPHVTSKRLAVEVVMPEEPVFAVGDKVRLTQVLLNLLSNAAKFTAPGGHIDVRLQALEPGRARITVVDDGCGIAPELLEKVFEPYVQAGGQGDGTSTGLGLGLSVARRLVELHGGSIRAESAGHGAGSRFILELPTVPAAAVPAPAPVSGAAPTMPSTALRVLVVDDSRDAAESLAMLVRLAGHEALTAYDGRSAVRLGSDYRPDVVFLDIGMPGFDGFSTAQLLREQDWGRDVLVCALTGYGQHGLESRIGPDARFDRRFVKPMDPAALNRLLHEATSTRARHDAAVR